MLQNRRRIIIAALLLLLCGVCSISLIVGLTDRGLTDSSVASCARECKTVKDCKDVQVNCRDVIVGTKFVKDDPKCEDKPSAGFKCPGHSEVITERRCDTQTVCTERQECYDVGCRTCYTCSALGACVSQGELFRSDQGCPAGMHDNPSCDSRCVVPTQPCYKCNGANCQNVGNFPVTQACPAGSSRSSTCDNSCVAPIKNCYKCDGNFGCQVAGTVPSGQSCPSGSYETSTCDNMCRPKTCYRCGGGGSGGQSCTGLDQKVETEDACPSGSFTTSNCDNSCVQATRPCFKCLPGGLNADGSRYPAQCNTDSMIFADQTCEDMRDANGNSLNLHTNSNCCTPGDQFCQAPGGKCDGNKYGECSAAGGTWRPIASECTPGSRTCQAGQPGVGCECVTIGNCGSPVGAFRCNISDPSCVATGTTSAAATTTTSTTSSPTASTTSTPATTTTSTPATTTTSTPATTTTSTPATTTTSTPATTTSTPATTTTSTPATTTTSTPATTTTSTPATTTSTPATTTSTPATTTTSTPATTTSTPATTTTSTPATTTSPTTTSTPSTTTSNPTTSVTNTPATTTTSTPATTTTSSATPTTPTTPITTTSTTPTSPTTGTPTTSTGAGTPTTTAAAPTTSGTLPATALISDEVDRVLVAAFVLGMGYFLIRSRMLDQMWRGFEQSLKVHSGGEIARKLREEDS